MLARLADVLCDTSFLVHIHSVRILNIDSLTEEIGDVSFVVPDAVVAELCRLRDSSHGAARALEAMASRRTVDLGGDQYADAAIVGHVRRNGGIVATMDRALKRAVRNAGGSVMSVSGDRIVMG